MYVLKNGSHYMSASGLCVTSQKDAVRFTTEQVTAIRSGRWFGQSRRRQDGDYSAINIRFVRLAPRTAHVSNGADVESPF